MGRALSPRARRSVFHSRPGPPGSPLSCRYQRKGGELHGAAAGGRGVVCTRVPGDGPAGRRRMPVWTVTATLGAVTELGDHLRCEGIEVVTLESTSGITGGSGTRSWRPAVLR